MEWLNEGDKNYAYFHQVVKGRKYRNHIHSVCDERGIRYEGEEVAEQFVSHFQKFLGDNREVTPINDLNDLIQLKVRLITL